MKGAALRRTERGEGMKVMERKERERGEGKEGKGDLPEQKF